MTKLIELSTDELAGMLKKEDTRIIDVRPVEAYNGWKLKNEIRGGHIKGAKSLPKKWSEEVDWLDVVRSKHVLPEHKIVVYGYTTEQSEIVANSFITAGYNNIFIYNNFIKEWAGDQEWPM